ncbi:hypothetical protein DPMN_126990 [Dreissena polymorpha]|uniref:Uncharacterized protein n=1 Tax=Dreissena polymorpha TaxID=45954 RepID=A0A9D4GYC3_DREPO|nr:hypothetical protein DPMN_126990 [Dreissena polymorpha]
MPQELWRSTKIVARHNVVPHWGQSPLKAKAKPDKDQSPLKAKCTGSTARSEFVWMGGWDYSVRQLLTKFGDDRMKFRDRPTDQKSDSYIAPITNETDQQTNTPTHQQTNRQGKNNMSPTTIS